uniref:Tyrosine specific protein phosphatases domain-containing protein n=1 Tax=Neobodo designis TaxID=312471 RepID=A0A7S1MB65_NEODS|mmetsp:Transcript_37497/g.115789  ORF Transcript_37497/g.115789 Transcript_37497/m.115789 type:complete len:371 (+) Transcript_37497:227-1339(+)
MSSPRPCGSPSAAASLSRQEEHRLVELRARCEGSNGEPLTPAEQEEYLTLEKKHRQFEEQGLLNLKRGKADVPVEGADEPGVGTAIGSAFRSAASAGLFWGSLAATAAPGYFGRKMGLTNEFKHWNWITDTLVLGALPVVSKVGSSGNHLEQIRAQCEKRETQIGLVVSCLTKPEMEGFGVAFPRFANHRDWADQLGVFNAELLEITDMCADGADHAEIARVVERMKTIATDLRAATYVHCKAGKGRSWMVTMCYLTTQEGMTFDHAMALVKEKRHQVSPSPSQVRFARDFCTWYNGNRAARARYNAAHPAADQDNGGGSNGVSSPGMPLPLAQADAGLGSAPSRQDLDRMAGAKAAETEWDDSSTPLPS